jgi:hypothetical protein
MSLERANNPTRAEKSLGVLIRPSRAKTANSRHGSNQPAASSVVRLDALGIKELLIGSFVGLADAESLMAEFSEIAWHKEQTAKNRTILEE